jgi:hypothetical protein
MSIPGAGSGTKRPGELIAHYGRGTIPNIHAVNLIKAGFSELASGSRGEAGCQHPLQTFVANERTLMTIRW